METNYIALAVPVFFAAIGVEYLASRRRGLRLYRFNDAVSDLSAGMLSQLGPIFCASVQVAIYQWCYARRVATVDSALMQWTIAFVAVDFVYYWWHRLSHTVNILWAAHIVHHQSEEYNLAVALRQAILTSWTGLPFYLPLAFVGIPTSVYATTLAFSTLYQFWIHTRLVRPVAGPVGALLNLPSHHRVHHAVNRPYLDKNFGATLIVWDRLFGTFIEEREPPRYGITQPLASFNPVWAQVHYWCDLARALRRERSLRGWARVVFGSPAQLHPTAPVMAEGRGWGRAAIAGARAARQEADGVAPPGVPTPLLSSPLAPALGAAATESELEAEVAPYDPPLSRAAFAYVLASFVPLVAATFLLMLWGARLPGSVRLAAAVAIAAGLVALAGLLERRRWARPLEVVRLAASAAMAAVILAG